MMRIPHVLIVGGYYDSFRRLLSRGKRITAILPRGRNYELKPEVNAKYFFADVTNTSECLRIAELVHADSPIDAVVSHYELAIPSAAAIAAQLNIPGPAIEPIQSIRNKMITREIGNNSGEISAAYKEVRLVSDAKEFLNDFGKAVLKPSGGVGGRDIRVVKSKSEIEDYFCEVQLSNEGFQIEQFIPGYEFSVEGFITGGIHKTIALTGKSQPAEPFCVETLHYQPIEREISDLTSRVNEILTLFYGKVGYEFGATHSEFRLTPDRELFLLEGHLRSGGLSISELTRERTGFDALTFQVESYLQEQELPKLEINKHAVLVCGISCAPGRILDIELSNELQSFDAVPLKVRFNPAFAIGDEIPKVHKSRYVRFGGYVICEFEDDCELSLLVDTTRAIAEGYKYVQ